MLGKLGARLIHVVAFVALGLPVVSLLMLYGGLNPVNICYVYVGTASLVFVTAGFSILISILARRPRDAILATYGLGAIWLVGPVWLEPMSRYLDGVLAWVPPVNDGAAPLQSPVYLVVGNRAEHELDDGRVDARLDDTLVQLRVEVHHHVDRPGVDGLALSGSVNRRLAAVAGQFVAGGKTADGVVHPFAGGVSPVRGGALRRGNHPQRAAREQDASSPLRRGPDALERAFHPHERRPQMDGQPAGGLVLHRALGLLSLRRSRPRPGRRHHRQVARSLLEPGQLRRAVREHHFGSAGDPADFCGGGLEHHLRARAGHLDQPGDQPPHAVGDHPRQAVRRHLERVRWLGIGLVGIWATGLLLGGIHPIGLLAAIAILGSAGWLTAAIGVLASTLASNSIRALFLTFVAVFLFVLGSGWPEAFWSSLAPYQDMARVSTARVPQGLSQFAALAPLVLYIVGMALGNVVMAALFTLCSVKRLRTTWGRA